MTTICIRHPTVFLTKIDYREKCVHRINDRAESLIVRRSCLISLSICRRNQISIIPKPSQTDRYDNERANESVSGSETIPDHTLKNPSPDPSAEIQIPELPTSVFHLNEDTFGPRVVACLAQHLGELLIWLRSKVGPTFLPPS